MTILPSLITWTSNPVSLARISFATSPLIPTYSGQGPSKFLTLYQIFKNQMLSFFFVLHCTKKRENSPFRVVRVQIFLHVLGNPSTSRTRTFSKPSRKRLHIKNLTNEIHLYANASFIPRNKLTRKSIVSIFGGSPQCAGNSIFCENTAVAKIVSSEIMNRLLIILCYCGVSCERTN